MIRPVRVGRITSGFGARRDPILGAAKSFHSGVDFGVPEGTPVFCVADGRVARSYLSNPKPPLRSYGECVVVQHDAKESLYAHLSRRVVRAGDVVRAGQIIGYSGNTGASTGPHLHFEIRIGGDPVDPMPFIPKEVTT